MEGLFQQNQFGQKESERKKDNFTAEDKAVFSKDKKSRKFQLINVKIPDMNPPKKEYFIFDKNTIPVPRQVYVPPIKKSMRIQLQRQEYDKFKSEFIDETKVEQIQDPLWNGQPPIKYYERGSGKDLFFNYRSQRFAEYIARKNAFLPKIPLLNGDIRKVIDSIKEQSIEELQRLSNPYFFIEDHYKNLDKEFKQLHSLIKNANFKEIPAIANALQFDLLYKQDIYKIWSEIEQTVTRHLHHYTPQELIAIKQGLASTFPKAGDYKLHQQILLLVIEDFDRLSVTDLTQALYAFRLLNNENFSSKIIHKLITLLPTYEKNPKELANVFYSIANNYQKKHQRKHQVDASIDQKIRTEIVKSFVNALKANLYDMDSITRILLGLSIMRVPDFHDLVFVLENQITECDEFQTAHILYALSKINNGFHGGELSTYKKLLTPALKYWDQYENLEKSRIYYAFAQMGIEFDQTQWIKENMLKFTYSELQNVVYGLLFYNIQDEEIWKNFVRNIGYSKEIVPIANYYCFKQAYTMLKPKNWNLEPFEQACQQAEYMFQAVRLDHFYNHPKQVDFQIELKMALDYEWKPYYSWNNTYYLQIVLEDQRIAVILQTPTLTINGKPRPQLLLQQRVMATQDWKLIIIDEAYLNTLVQGQRAEYLRKTINDAIEEQKPKYKVWESARREEIYAQLVEVAERTITPGKRITLPEDIKDLSQSVYQTFERAIGGNLYSSFERAIGGNLNSSYIQNKRLTPIARTTKSEDRQKSYTFSVSSCVEDHLIRDLLNTRCAKIDTNKLDHFRKVIAAQSKNEVLNLSNMNLSKHSASVIGQILQHSKDFKSVIIRENNLQDRGVEQIVRAISIGTNRSIIHLDISRTNVTANGFKYIFSHIQSIYSLISLDCSYNHMSHVGSAALQELILQHGNIQFLNVYQSFSQKIRGNFVALNMGFNDIQTTEDIDFSEDLDLADNPLKDIKHLSKSISYWNIIQLNLSNSGLTVRQLSQLVDGIQNHDTLSVLKLANNNFSGVLSCITQLLSSNRSINNLVINDCKITDFISLNEGLYHNKSLKKLNLSGIAVGVEGAKTLSESINRLDELYMNKCQLRHGANFILKSLLTSKIKIIEIRENMIPDLDHLTVLVEHNRNIVKVDASLNVIHYKLLTKLENSIQFNKQQQKNLFVPRNKQKLTKLAKLDSNAEMIKSQVNDLGVTLQQEQQNLQDLLNEEQFWKQKYEQILQDEKNLKLQQEQEKKHYAQLEDENYSSVYDQMNKEKIFAQKQLDEELQNLENAERQLKNCSLKKELMRLRIPKQIEELKRELSQIESKYQLLQYQQQQYIQQLG